MLPTVPSDTPTPSSAGTQKSWLRDVLARDALTYGAQQKIFGSTESELAWIFDIKNVSLQPKVLATIAELFWEHYRELPRYQIGGMETAAIPLIAAIVLEGHRRGKNVSGFYVRKSRKKAGLVKQIEGSMTDDPIILVDDLINEGKSAVRQIELLKSEGRTVHSLFAVVRFRKDEEYQHILDQGISLYALFALPDFSINYLETSARGRVKFEQAAYFKSTDASYVHVRSKSVPLISDDRIYYATDNGHVWCLQKDTLRVIWHRKLGLFTKQHVFASPLLIGDALLVASYHGIVHRLHAKGGRIMNRASVGDRITATPLLLNEQTIVVGVDDRTSGLIVALHTDTLEKLWEHPTHAPIVGTGVVLDTDRFVINDTAGTFYWGTSRGITKTRAWTHSGPVTGNIGLDPHRHNIVWGTMNGEVLTASVRHGHPKTHFKAEASIAGTPYVYGNTLLVASLDGNLYCLNLENGELRWKFETHGRVFASPVVHSDVIYLGSNDNRLYAIDMRTGKERGFFQATERITSPIVIDDEHAILLPTFANELYRLSIEIRVK